MLAVCASVAADDFLSGLPDPTRPPLPGERLVVEKRSGMVLFTTTISPERRTAVINGKTFSEGDKIGGARVIAINPYEVTLSQAGREVALRLMPQLVKQRIIPEADNHAATP